MTKQDNQHGKKPPYKMPYDMTPAVANITHNDAGNNI